MTDDGTRILRYFMPLDCYFKVIWQLIQSVQKYVKLSYSWEG